MSKFPIPAPWREIEFSEQAERGADNNTNKLLSGFANENSIEAVYGYVTGGSLSNYD